MFCFCLGLVLFDANVNYNLVSRILCQNKVSYKHEQPLQIFFYLVNVHKFCLIYFSNAHVMFGCDGKAPLQ